MDEHFTLRTVRILWYKEEEYQELLMITEDKDHLPATWEEWKETYFQEGNRAEKSGYNPVQVWFDLEQFKKTGLTNTDRNRYMFAVKQKNPMESFE